MHGDVRRHPWASERIKPAARVKAGKTDTEIEDAAFLLLDQARIMDGEPVTDPKAFAMRMSKVMEMGLVG